MKWKDKNVPSTAPGEFIYDADKDQYRDIKQAVIYGEKEDIISESEKILGGQQAKIILMNNLFGWVTRPFTGSKNNEEEWLKTLTKDQLAMYREAQSERGELADKLLSAIPDILSSPVLVETYRLYSRTGETSQLPPLAGRTINISGYGEIPLTKDEQMMYQSELTDRYMAALKNKVSSKTWGVMSAKNRLETYTNAVKTARKEAKDVMERKIAGDPARRFAAKKKEIERQKFLNEAR